MDSGGSKSESQDSTEPTTHETVKFNLSNIKLPSEESSNSPKPSLQTPTSKGILNAKKRLRAFSIQKKAPLTPKPVTKAGTGTATVYIGKLTGVKVAPKVVEDPNVEKRPPRPPKPQKKTLTESYTEVRKKTLSDIEEMKRKMELVELGIPLGLICPSSFSAKAMPTKAMPPIKTLLDPEKVDEIIREAKKAKAEGKEFKFDYHKLLPDYDNPFQRKKEDLEADKVQASGKDKEKPKGSSLNWKYDTYRRNDKNKYRDDREYKHDRRKSDKKEKLPKHDTNIKKSDKRAKETNVDLNDYLVCDSWSLDNDDKNSTSSTNVDEQLVKNIPLPDERPSAEKATPKRLLEEVDSAVPKIEKLEPVKDSFTYEIDPDDEVLDIFDEDCSLDKFAKTTSKKEVYDSPVDEVIELNQSLSKDTSLDGTIDDTFLESVINEIKQEYMSDEGEDKGLVEYEISPTDDTATRESVTPELKDYHSSQRSDYSDGYRSTESGYKSTESGYKSSKSYQSDTDYKSSENRSKSADKEHKFKKRHKSTKSESDYKSNDDFSIKSYKPKEIGYKSPEIQYKLECDYKSSGGIYKSNDNYKAKSSVESRRMSFVSSSKEFEEESKLSKSTIDSLETWSFVLKICQPLLFRHDRNKCYRETEVLPKLWYTENPKICNCVKDRSVVYEELEMCKMALVDRVYGCDQIPDPPFVNVRSWYPRADQCLADAPVGPPPSDDWEVEEITMSAGHRSRPSMTPQRNEEIYLDREYQRFMQAVLSDVSESKQETSRSTTPVTQEVKKKKKVDDEEDKKKAKKIKLSSEGWSQESEVDEEPQKNKKLKMEKDRVRKRKHSVSSVSDSDLDVKKKRKAMKKKENKKSKLKMEKRRRLSKKYLKKLKEKEKNKKMKLVGDSDIEKESKKRKLKKKRLQKLKKKNQKKKKSKPKSSSSSDSSSSSSSDSSSEEEKRKKRKKEKKKRKKSTSESSQSEELFDVNILNNIKKERLTDDEKNQKLNEFSPRKMPREIINVKELQNDFVGNIEVKKEVVEREKEGVEKCVVQEAAVEKTVVRSPELNEGGSMMPVEKYECLKEQQDSNQTTPQIQPPPEESNLSQCSSQESVASKDRPVYEKDESHLRPSSQNSNYSFNDVISASHQADDARSASCPINDVRKMSDQLLDVKPESQQMSNASESLTSVTTSDSNRMSETRYASHQMSDVTDSQISEIMSDSKRISGVKPPWHMNDVSSATHETDVTDSRMSDSLSDRNRMTESSYRDESRSAIRHLSDVSDSPISTTSDSQRMHYATSARQMNDERSENRQNDIISVIGHRASDTSGGHDVASEHAMIDDASVGHLNDVMSGQYQKDEEKFGEGYEHESYEMYEQMAMAYQSDVASQVTSPPGACSQRIETVVRTRGRGEIKCDWRAGDGRVQAPPQRPSRWGLKPGEVNIVLTGHGSDEFSHAAAEADNRVYQIQSIANRTDTSSNTGYDEAYMSMYGASDRLQYGDCFATQEEPASVQAVEPKPEKKSTSSLDARISHALRSTVLGAVAKDDDEETDTDGPDKGILVMKSLALNDKNRGAKRVSFADGYKPGQDSDLEDPPKKKKRPRRLGCAWPCPATHPDHVPLWDALPPPPPPPGSPPPPAHAHVVPRHVSVPQGMMPHPMTLKFEPSVSIPSFMPPEPPPGLISF